MTNKLSRREFLRVSSLTVAGALLVACVPATAPSASSDSAPGAEGGEIVVARPEHPSQPIVQDAPAHLAATAATGIQLNFQPVAQADYPAKVNVWLASNQVPDLMRADIAEIRDFASPSVLQSMLPLLDQHGPNLRKYMDANPEVSRWTIGGEHYSVPVLHYHWERSAPMPVIRKDLLDAAGLPIPTTFEELHTTLKELQAANPGMLGWTIRNGIKRMLMIVAYPMGSGMGAWFNGRDVPHFDEAVDGGRWVYGPTQPEFKDVLAYFAALYSEGILDPDVATTTSDQWHERNSSNALFSYDNFGFANRWNQAFRAQDASITRGPWAPFPTLAGAKGARQNDFDNFEGGWSISANTANPEWAVQVLEWQISPEGLDTTAFGIEGEHYTLTGERPAGIDDYSRAGVSAALPLENRQILPEIVEKYANEPQPGYAFMSELGLGLLDLTVLANAGANRVWLTPGEAEEWTAMVKADPGLHREVLAPPFTSEEAERLKTIQADLNAIADPAIEKVILGQMSLADYDAEVQAMVNAGALEMEEIYNAAEARL
jgi:putative aldouronate transport system substrate-binding protein